MRRRGMGQTVVDTPLSDWGLMSVPCANWGTPTTASGNNTVIGSGLSSSAVTWGALLLAGVILFGVFENGGRG